MKTAKNKLKAFTLIELLVVITIIGILASIVVVNLNTTRGRGQDVAVKEQMSQIRAASELYYDTHYGYSDKANTGAYGGVADVACETVASWTGTYFADTDFQNSVKGIRRNSSNAPKCWIQSAGAGTTAQSWMVVSKLRLGTSAFWCVDSFGTSKEISSIPSLAVSADMKCP